MTIVDPACAYLELLPGACPQIKLTAETYDGCGRRSQATTYAPVLGGGVDVLPQLAVAISIADWAALIGPYEEKRIDLIISEDFSGVFLSHEFEGRVVRAAVSAESADLRPHEWDQRMTLEPASEIKQLSAPDFADLLVDATSH